MLNQSDAMRVMAAKYFQLAKDTKDQRERSKFFDYAMLYAQLSKQAEQRETSTAMAGQTRSAKMSPSEETFSHGLTVDELAAST